MSRRVCSTTFAVVLVLVPLLACRAVGSPPVGRPAPELEIASRYPELEPEFLRRVLQHSPLPDPPPDPTNAWADREDAAHLGRFLFFDRRLSGDGSVSCATCHDPLRSFADGRQLARGMGEGTRHTPTLWNVAHQRWLFWDGRADSLWTQALSPLETPHEHGSDREHVASVIWEDEELAEAFRGVFGEPHGDTDRQRATSTFVNVGKAIAAYERELVSRDSAFDRFVAALSAGRSDAVETFGEKELRGLRSFVGKANCRLCHSGPLFSDREFHDTRVPVLGQGRAVDTGRYGGIQDLLESEFRGGGGYSDAEPEDSVSRTPVLRGETWGEFKTPSLRNVALTAPYMHQGQIATLHEVVRFYSTLEGARPPHDHGETTMTPLDLTEEEIDELVAFLRTLTDDRLAPALLRAPASPSLKGPGGATSSREGPTRGPSR